MTIEGEFFKKRRPIFNKLSTAGFIKDGLNYQLQRSFMDNQFDAKITVNNDGRVSGTVIDNSTGEEYMPLRAIHCGPFATKVKAKYTKLLEEIANKCFIVEPFQSDQANRLAKWLDQEFHDLPEFVFKRLPNYAIFREPQSQKWYGLVMNIPRTKLTNKHTTSTENWVDVIDFRCFPQQRKVLLCKKGIYPGYHMNKNNWLNAILDDTLSDTELFRLIKSSRQILTKPQAWIVPANQKYYDIMHAFVNTDTIIWKQSTNIRVGDTVFLYVAAPIKAIIYRCQVTKTNIPYQYESPHLKITHVMRLQLEKEYDHDLFSLKFIKQHGVSSVQGPRHVPQELLQFLNK